jgi:hypothetical protein
MLVKRHREKGAVARKQHMPICMKYKETQDAVVTQPQIRDHKHLCRGGWEADTLYRIKPTA